MAMYNRGMLNRILCCAAAVTLLAGCTRSRDVQKDLKLTDVRTGWYDAGIVEGKNKLVPSISLKIQNVSSDEIANVQVNAIFRRVGEQEAWGEHFVRGVGSNGLEPGQSGGDIVLRSNLGYTSDTSSSSTRVSRSSASTVRRRGPRWASSRSTVSSSPISRASFLIVDF
jgi:hypothetical protein